MKSIYDEIHFFRQMFDMLAQQMGSNTEIVLHDPPH